MLTSTLAAPVKDWALIWLVSEPTWRAMTAPNGMETSAAGRMVTLAMNQNCSMNSRTWNGRRKIARSTVTDSANSLPGSRRKPRPRKGVLAAEVLAARFSAADVLAAGVLAGGAFFRFPGAGARSLSWPLLRPGGGGVHGEGGRVRVDGLGAAGARASAGAAARTVRGAPG